MNLPLVELRLFGGVRIQGVGNRADVLVRQPKRLALLCYLAIARPRGRRPRDKLVAMFWPELDDAHARNALSQSVHVIRSSLGADVIESVGDELGVSSRVSTDVTSFEHALANGDIAAALHAYEGELLDGFFVSNAPLFDEWLSGERTWLRDRACEAAWALAESAPSTAASERWARWASDLQFPDESAMRRLMSLLYRNGNRSAALSTFDQFAKRLSKELEVRPSAETLALAESIRTTDAMVEPPRLAQPHTTVVSASPPRRPTRRMLAGAFLMVAAAGGLVGYSLASPDAPAQTRLVVMPLENVGPSETAYFAAGLSEEIATRLASAPGLVVITGPSARRYADAAGVGAGGKTFFLEGSTRWADSAGSYRVRIMMRVVRAGDHAIVKPFSFEEKITSTTQLFDLISMISSRVVTEMELSAASNRWQHAKPAPTTNLAAYDDYLRGVEYARRPPTASNLLAAIRMLDRAVRADSSFALAFAQLSIVETNAQWLAGLGAEHFERARVAATRAVALDSSLAEAYTSLAHYRYACCHDYGGAIAALDRALALRPGDWQSVMFAGNVYKRQGQWTRAETAYRRAVQFNPLYRWPLNNLGHAQMWNRDYEGAERSFRQATAVEPQDVFAPAHMAWLSVLRDGNTTRARAILREAQPLLESPNDMRLPYYLAVVDRRYDEALATMKAPAPPPTGSLLNEWLVTDALRRAVVYRLKGDSARAMASFDSARSELDSVLHLPSSRDDRSQLWLRSALAIASAATGRRSEAAAHLDFVMMKHPIAVDAIEGPKYLQHAALAYVVLGDRARAISIIDTLLQVAAPVTSRSLAVEPFWDPLRPEPAFTKVLARRPHVVH